MSALYRRAVYTLLMLLHDGAEAVWHWAWRASRRYSIEPPPHTALGTYSCSITPVKGRLYGFSGGRVVTPSDVD
jgi:hypothetical protein